MSILKTMREKKNRLVSQSHPFCNKPVSFRATYSSGVSLLSHLDSEIYYAEKGNLDDLIENLGLSKDVFSIFSPKIDEDSSLIIDAIIENLSEEPQKILFLLELSKMAYQGRKMSPEAEELVDIFADLLHLSKETNQLLKEIAREVKFQNFDRVKFFVSKLNESGIEFPDYILRYFAPQVVMASKIDNIAEEN